MYCLDTETLGFSSSSVLLSVAILPFDLISTDLNPVMRYYQLLDDVYFQKCDVGQQIKQYNRKIDTKTLDWWSKQSKIAQDKSLIPNFRLDVPILDMIKNIDYYVYHMRGEDRSKPPMFWERGILDQMVIEDICQQTSMDNLVPYHSWRDIRTFIDCMAADSRSGYTPIPGFDEKVHVQKHDPVHDVAYDVLQMLYCINDEQR